MDEYRISWRNGDMRGAEWVSGENVDAAVAKFRQQKSVLSNFFITSISHRCGAPNSYKRAGAWVHGECQRLTTGKRCHQHKGV